jgi:hypothetical protein
MADDASDTFGGGLRNFLGALGFILPLVGVEELVRHFVDAQHPSLPGWISGILIVSGYPIYVSPAIWKRLRAARPADAIPLQYLRHEDAELGPAIIMMMAWESAWGKWYAAQCLANNPNGTPNQREADLMMVAAGRVWDALKDGRLVARGRKPEQLDYESIPQTHWRSSPLHMFGENATLWKMILIPTGGAEFKPDGTVIGHDQSSVQRTEQLATYDSLIVSARQFENLWPRRDKQSDAARNVLLKKAKKAGADPAEIVKLSRSDYYSPKIALGISAALPLLLLFGALVGPDLYRRATVPVDALKPEIGFTQQQVDEKIANAVANLNSQLTEANRQKEAAMRDAEAVRKQIQNAPPPPRPN